MIDPATNEVTKQVEGIAGDASLLEDEPDTKLLSSGRAAGRDRDQEYRQRHGSALHRARP
jgi:hypothetical protein